MSKEGKAKKGSCGGDGEPGITDLGITENGITESGIKTQKIGNKYNGI